MDIEELFQKFKAAIDNEYDAFRFYNEIAEKTNDSETKVVFARLAKEEWDHMHVIMKRYKILRNYKEAQLDTPA